MNISIVTSTYKPSYHFQEFVNSVTVIQRYFEKLELVVVEDSNSAKSLDYAGEVLAKSGINEFKLIGNQNNFGQHISLFEGLKKARHEYIAIIDSDNEEQPTDLVKMLDLLAQNSESNVVYSHGNRPGRGLRKFTSRIYYKIFSSLSGINGRVDVFTMRLATRELVERICKYTEQEVNIGALFLLNQKNPQYYLTEKFHKGSTSYSLRKQVILAIKGLTSVSLHPLYFIAFLGFLGSVISTLGVFYFVFFYFLSSNMTAGFTSLAVLISFFSGLILLSLGILASYLAAVSSETKRRPRHSFIALERNEID